MKHNENPILSAEDYIAAQRPEFTTTLEALRATIKAVVPQAEEMIRYQVICYKYHYMLVGIGTTKTTCSFYVMNPELVRQMKSELKDFKSSGAAIHFSIDELLPLDLIK